MGLAQFKHIRERRLSFVEICGWWSPGIDPQTHDYIRVSRPFSDMLHELYRERIPYFVHPIPDHAIIIDVESTDDWGSLKFWFEWMG